MTHYYLSVGRTVAATFDTRQAAMQRLKYFAVGVGVTIKEGRPEGGFWPTQKRNTSKTLRGKIDYLKPGEFKLPV